MANRLSAWAGRWMTGPGRVMGAWLPGAGRLPLGAPRTLLGWRGNATTTTADPAPSASPLFQAAMQEAAASQPGGSAPARAAQLAATGSAPLLLPTFTTGNLPGSHRKLAHLARVLPGMTLVQAQRHMEMSLKKPAATVAKLMVRAAAALRHNYHQHPDAYVVREAWVGKGIYRKSMDIKGRGRTGILHRPTSHLKIRLALRPSVPVDAQAARVARMQESLRKQRLWLPMVDSRPMRFAHPVWSRKPWKYVTSRKWTNPDIVKMRPRD